MTQKETEKILEPKLWIEKHGNYLYNFAMSRLSSKDLAEDLLQETFLAAYRNKDRFHGDSNERTWLTSILKRKIFDYYRRKFRSKEQLVEFDSPFIQDEFMHGRWKENRVPHPWDMDEDWSSDEEVMKFVRLCISYLPEKWKAVFSLKHVEQADNKEIQKELQISESNIWVILHRSRLKLRECIEKLMNKR